MKFHWFLPTNGGDGRTVVGGGHGVAAQASSRPASVPYLGQIARSAEQLGFEAALTPTGAWCEDAWVSTAMLSSVSERLKFLVAFRPGVTAPFLSAQMAGTFQNLSGGRLLLNVVTGGEDAEQAMFGDFSTKEERYARADEFLEIVRRLWTGETLTFEGKYLSVENATLHQIPDPLPEIYFGGSSAAGIAVAAKHADVYLTWGEPPEAVAEKIARVRRAAAEQGRELTYGIRLHTIARATSEEAWAEADRLLENISAEDIARIQAGLKRSASEGQQRMLALNKGSKDGLEIYPNLWAGVGLVRGGAGTAMVGSYTEIADLIEAYRDVGIDEFVLSGYPHLEEAYWFGEGVLPELTRRGLWEHPAPPRAARAAVPFGAPVKAVSAS
ncbi:alkanesulfonate monooxygenase SsuD [Gordonia polyisoprenivorans VH2]|uniref:Alkanesulfonate monooxygenase SsuD n=2 Tax=Gordonia polyisoprenivorans TaxID=84595 RepID=H6MXH2_GORPV|nr:LLM class flavin-dependent oxidoreductase [Gordonia polyisoprenivorans]AFA75497.1 alkanesulfonate monooxygenase SsuD [Gordonia polyisoprenivorans VH2]NKY05104.1 LLM class flavin-dependent oxidoreductase [Gordonia polyisoprenivorans]GAB21412.1 alkanesulfonate monooxygenase [Gordonia polyisoprenivorans NBRC 16320 = JCM 10675]